MSLKVKPTQKVPPSEKLGSTKKTNSVRSLEAEAQSSIKEKREIETEDSKSTPSSINRPSSLYNRDGIIPATRSNIISKRNDSFYSVVDRENNFSEDKDGYTVEAYSPLEEQDNLQVTINNNKLIISGSRIAQNAVENDSKKMTTNNYQTFREEYNIGSSVYAEGMTRERQGDYIRIFIPKSKST